jgi:hypothetical protein
VRFDGFRPPGTESDLDTVFATLPRLGAGALVIGR